MKPLLKVNKGFNITDTKVIHFDHNVPSNIYVQQFYTEGTATEHSILKSKCRDIRKVNINLRQVKKANHMSREKIADVQKLLEKLGVQ